MAAMKSIVPLLLSISAAVLASCSQRVDRITVDVSERKLTAKSKGRVVMVMDCETSKYGIGTRIGSRRTPLGEFKIAAKEAGHRYGPVMRLNGYQGYRRGILFHRNLDGKPNGTNGCCCPLDDRDYERLWRNTQVGAAVSIRM